MLTFTSFQDKLIRFSDINGIPSDTVVPDGNSHNDIIPPVAQNTQDLKRPLLDFINTAKTKLGYENIDITSPKGVERLKNEIIDAILRA